MLRMPSVLLRPPPSSVLILVLVLLVLVVLVLNLVFLVLNLFLVVLFLVLVLLLLVLVHVLLLQLIFLIFLPHFGSVGHRAISFPTPLDALFAVQATTSRSWTPAGIG